MIAHEEVLKQLERMGVGRLPLCRAEINQLHQILVPGEEMEYLLAGRYMVGYAVLVATNKRLLLVDKTIGGLIIEDFPFDMIAEVEYIKSLYGSKLIVFARSKKVEFRAYKGSNVRDFAQYLEQRVMEIRQILRSSNPATTLQPYPVSYPYERQANEQGTSQASPGLFIP